MKSRHYPPAYFRYFKARLWNLTRPSIWGTAIFLSVVGLAIKEYWAHPDILTSRQSKPVAIQQEPNSTLSPEDRANVADIDNLPVLVYDSKLGGLPPLDAPEPISKIKTKTPLKEAISTQKTANDIKLNVADNSVSLPQSENPFLTQANNLLQLNGNIQRSNGFLGLNASKLSSTQPETKFTSDLNLSGLNTGEIGNNNSTNNTVAVNPLQASLNSASTSQNLSNLNSLQPPFNQSFNSNQTNLSNSSPNTSKVFRQLQPTNTLPNQSITQPYTPSTGLTVQGINPIPNSAGYTQPTVTNQPQTYYSNYNNGSITQPSPYYGNYNNGNLNSNFNNNFNNSQMLPSTVQSIPVTPLITSTVPNYTTPYSSIPNANQNGVPSNTTLGNGALINQGSQQSNQVQQYNYPSPPNLLPSQYPSPVPLIRY